MAWTEAYVRVRFMSIVGSGGRVKYWISLPFPLFVLIQRPAGKESRNSRAHPLTRAPRVPAEAVLLRRISPRQYLDLVEGY